MMSVGKISNWLKAFCSLGSGMEAPDCYWLWSGIFILSSAMQRRLWLPYGFDNILPNLYVIFVSKPGKARKGAPVMLAKEFLSHVGVNISMDSGSKQALCRGMAEVCATTQCGDEALNHSSMAIVGEEFSSLLAVNPELMVDFLTAIYDWRGPQYDYSTIARNSECIEYPCLSILAATTPTSLARNIPIESFGDGFFARTVLVAGKDKKQWVAIPELTVEQEILRKNLMTDLEEVKKLNGPFRWHPEAKQLFINWYESLGSMYDRVTDERFHTLINRMHVQVLKTAMALHVSNDRRLVLTTDDIGRAITLVNALFDDLDYVFEGFGRNPRIDDYRELLRQLMRAKKIKFSQLLRNNLNNIESAAKLNELIDTLASMNRVHKTDHETNGDYLITWIGG